VLGVAAVIARILLVDDDPDVRRLFARLLRSEGYSVADVDSGRTALSLIDKSEFDCVLCDFHLGNDGVDGLDVLNRFNRLFPEKCKILISGSGTDFQSQCEQIGALYLSKPLALGAFLSALKILLPHSIVPPSRRRTRRQREKGNGLAGVQSATAIRIAK
jgi:two-component system, OmpR family, KDP operon response regulator KdpE